MEETKKLQLKTQALLEKVSTLTMEYENQIANLRVEVTMLSEELQNTRNELANVVDQMSAEGENEVPQEETQVEG